MQRLIIVAALLLGATNAMAYDWIAAPSCPDLAKGNLWSKYFLAQYPMGGKVPMAAAVFDLSQVKDKTAVGAINPAFVYRVIFRNANGPAGPKGWMSYHAPGRPEFSSSRGPTGADIARMKSDMQSQEGLSADPALRQINIEGTVFAFDDVTGILMDRLGQPVGQLECHIKEW